MERGKTVELYEEAAKLIAAKGSGVLLTLVATDGTGPQKAGSKMLVLADGSVRGSIGGGSFEKDMQRLALEVLVEGKPRLLTVAAEGEGLSACGGKKTVFFDPISGGPHLILIGNGHVGQAVAKIAVGCGWQVSVRDDRPLPAGGGFGEFTQITDYTEPFSGLLPGEETFVLIASRSHDTDLQALRAALKTSAAFIGLLGSSRKKTAFFAALREEGETEEQLGRVKSPVGLDIGASSPAEIAVSIMAQMIQKGKSRWKVGC